MIQISLVSPWGELTRSVGSSNPPLLPAAFAQLLDQCTESRAALRHTTSKQKDELIAGEKGSRMRIHSSIRQQPGKFWSAEVEENRRQATLPLTEQRAVLYEQPLYSGGDGRAIGPRVRKPRRIGLTPRAVHHPYQLAVESIARPTLFVFQVRMLKLDHPPMLGLYIRNVLRAIGSEMNDFLPSIWKLVLPVLRRSARVCPTGRSIRILP